MQTVWKLRPGVKWHDGAPFTAEDVVFGWQVARHPEIPKGGGGTPRELQTIEATDPFTLVMTWSTTYFHPLELSVRELWPYPRHILAEAFEGDKTAFQAHPYFTADYVHLGPYRLVDYGLGEREIFERFDDYYLGSPRISRITIQTIPELNTMLANFLAGTVDILPERTVPVRVINSLQEEFRQTGGGGIASRQGNWWFLKIQFNPEWVQPPELAANVHIRRGLAHGFDRDGLRELAFPGFADTEPDTFLTKHDTRNAIVGKPFARYNYDPNRAAQELAEGGWRRTVGGELVNATGGPARLFLRTEQGNNDLRAFVADSWRQLGVDVQEEEIPPALRQDNEYRAKLPSLEWRARGQGDRSLPSFDSRERPTPQTRYQGANVGGYINPGLDRLIDTLYGTLDENEQGRILRDIGEILASDLPALPLYWEVTMVAVRKGVRALTDDFPYTTLSSGLSRNSHLWDRE
jgi:peptide/nickel transport system substrate-binding protein